MVEKENNYDVAYMSTDELIYPDLKLKEVIGFFKDFMPGFDSVRAADELARLDLDLKKTYRKLSMGQKRIVAFVMTICSNAKVYLFDEPLTNLDIIYRDYLIETLIKDICDDKVFLISSHELMELESVFSHVMILKGTKLGALVSTEEIRSGGQSIADFYKEAVKC